LKLAFLYWTYWGGGGHNILRLIPAALNSYDWDFGPAVKSISCDVYFPPNNKPGADSQPSYTRFNLKLEKLPKWRLHKNQHFLEVEYVSKLSSTEPPFLPNSSSASTLLKNLCSEFRFVLTQISQEKDLQKINFDFKTFISAVERMECQFPTQDTDLIALTERARHFALLEQENKQ
jgi:hypothetical protein